MKLQLEWNCFEFELELNVRGRCVTETGRVKTKEQRLTLLMEPVRGVLQNCQRRSQSGVESGKAVLAQKVLEKPEVDKNGLGKPEVTVTWVNGRKSGILER